MKKRLDCLAKYPWSSWRVYSGAEPVPDWLSIEPIASHCGGRSRAEKRTALRQYTEEPLRQGHIESPWKRVAGGLVLGDEDFAERLLRGPRVNMAEQKAARRLRPRVKWQQVVQAAEKLRGMRWSELKKRHGEWGGDGAMYFAVRQGGWRLVEVLREVGSGLKYQAAAQGGKIPRRRGDRKGFEKDPFSWKKCSSALVKANRLNPNNQRFRCDPIAFNVERYTAQHLVYTGREGEHAVWTLTEQKKVHPKARVLYPRSKVNFWYFHKEFDAPFGTLAF